MSFGSQVAILRNLTAPGAGTPVFAPAVYFPESGFASVVANGSGQRSIEVGLIGRCHQRRRVLMFSLNGLESASLET